MGISDSAANLDSFWHSVDLRMWSWLPLTPSIKGHWFVLPCSLCLTHACTHTNIFSYCLHIFCGVEQSQTPAQYISEDMTPFPRRIMLKCCYHSALVASLDIWCSLIPFFLGSRQVSCYTSCIFQIDKSPALYQDLLRGAFPMVMPSMWAAPFFRSHPLIPNSPHDWSLSKCHLKSMTWILKLSTRAKLDLQ